MNDKTRWGRERLQPGQVFGTAIVRSEEYEKDDRPYVDVECWSCKRVRPVLVYNLLAGKSRLCADCAIQAKLCAGRRKVTSDELKAAAKGTPQLLGPSPNKE